MRQAGAVDRRWSSVRYRWLLPSARASQLCGRTYATLVGTLEFARDSERRRVACERVERWTGCLPVEARRTFRAALVSEAREEADSVYFATHEPALRRLLTTLTRVSGAPASADGARSASIEPRGRESVDSACAPPIDESRGRSGMLFVTLHFGSPVLGYLALRSTLGLDCSMVVRPLDASNPMHSAKQAYASAKVAWAERVGGQRFLGTDASSLVETRERLLAGRDVLTPIDVPGDVVARHAVVSFGGESVLLACGTMTLARLAHATVRPFVARRVGDGLELAFGRTISAGEDVATLSAGLDELSQFIRAFPGEWWMWPYLLGGDVPRPMMARSAGGAR